MNNPNFSWLRHFVRNCFLGTWICLWIIPAHAGTCAMQPDTRQVGNTTRSDTAFSEKSCPCLEFERNPFVAVQTNTVMMTSRDESEGGPHVVGGDDEVRWTVTPGVKVPAIKVTGLMRAGKGTAACAVVRGLGSIILREEQRVVLTESGGVSWFDVREISGRELSIRLETGDLVTGTFF